LIRRRKEVLKDGTVVWRARGVSVGKNPATGKRVQRTITCPTRRELDAELARIGVELARGTYRRPWDGLVPEVIDNYLANGADDWEENTRACYADILKPAREYWAGRKARTITREDVEDYKRHLRTNGRRHGGGPLSARSVNLGLGQLQAAFDLAERDGKVPSNPVRWVKRVKREETDRVTWGEEQVREFMTAAAATRLFALWLLSLLGLRRAEVLGLKWSDVSFTDGTLTIARTRVLISGKVTEKGPKSRRSARTLPLLGPVTAALEALYAVQAAERAAAGGACRADVDGSYVAADEAGEPLHPAWYSDEFARLCREAGLPPIRLHDCRHTANSLLEKLGVPDSLRAAWLGHTIAVNRGTYLHSRPEELAAVSAALGGIFQPV